MAGRKKLIEITSEYIKDIPIPRKVVSIYEGKVVCCGKPDGRAIIQLEAMVGQTYSLTIDRSELPSDCFIDMPIVFSFLEGLERPKIERRMPTKEEKAEIDRLKAEIEELMKDWDDADGKDISRQE